jgi:hypothetical protein
VVAFFAIQMFSFILEVSNVTSAQQLTSYAYPIIL